MTISNPLLKNSATATDNPTIYFNNVIQTIISLLLLTTVLYFLWHLVMGAFHMISSQGDPKKFEEARSSIAYAGIGLVIVFSIFAILKFIGTVFGIPGLDTLQISWPSL